MPLTYLWLFPLGLAIGAFGTLIGAGGGFILVPILLILYPNENTELITSISLAVVFFNALSGSLAYARMKRVDFKSGIVFAVATIPGRNFRRHFRCLRAASSLRLRFWRDHDCGGSLSLAFAKDDHVHGAAKAPSDEFRSESGKLDVAISSMPTACAISTPTIRSSALC